jgi:hypothetical protein
MVDAEQVLGLGLTFSNFLIILIILFVEIFFVCLFFDFFFENELLLTIPSRGFGSKALTLFPHLCQFFSSSKKKPFFSKFHSAICRGSNYYILTK